MPVEVSGDGISFSILDKVLEQYDVYVYMRRQLNNPVVTTPGDSLWVAHVINLLMVQTNGVVCIFGSIA